MKTTHLDSMFSVFLLTICLLMAHSEMVSNGPEVMVNTTRIIGQYTQEGQYRVATYLGLPYATPPVGQLRFQKTVPLQSLPPVIHATSFGADCISTFLNEHQSEDCLYLNVWVPAEATAPLPVMVWIHGGGFIAGSSNNPQGTSLAAENQVVVVSLNYRLGALGFLSTEDYASLGNYGLWDQHTALHWVRDHIAAFGGDPRRVTIFGESAGGKSVSFQVVSPHSGDLFHRAIIQSGTVLCPTALQWSPLQTAVRLAQAVGCPTASHQALVHCLRQQDAHRIASASGRLWDDDFLRHLIDFGWGPVEDGDFVPRLYQADGTPTPLSPTFAGSLMLGVNNNEGALLKTWRIPATYRLDRSIEFDLHQSSFFTRKFLPKVLAQMFKTLPEDAPSFGTASQAASCLYKNGVSDANISPRLLYSLYGDQAYVSPTFRFLDQWLNTSESRGKVYVYVFDNYPGVPVAAEGLEGMKHGDDVPYTFGTIEQKLQSMGMASDLVARETRLGHNFRKLLSNFAKSGDPASPAALDSNWPAWPPYDVQQQRYLSVSSNPAVADHYRDSYMTLWNHRVPRLVTRETGTGTSSYTCSHEDLIG